MDEFAAAQHELLVLRDRVIGLEAELNRDPALATNRERILDLEVEVTTLRTALREAENRIRDMEQSSSWRIGNRLVRAARLGVGKRG